MNKLNEDDRKTCQSRIRETQNENPKRDAADEGWRKGEETGRENNVGNKRADGRTWRKAGDPSPGDKRKIRNP